MRTKAIVSLVVAAGLAVAIFTVTSRGPSLRAPSGANPPIAAAPHAARRRPTPPPAAALSVPQRGPIAAVPDGSAPRPDPRPDGAAPVASPPQAPASPATSFAEEAVGLDAVAAGVPGRRSLLLREAKDEGDAVPGPAGFSTEAYAHLDENPFLRARTHPLSTFAIDVDTASYANVRRFLTAGRLPPKDAVRIEELVNYFRYDYREPSGGEPFSITARVGACPWADRHRLVLVGLRGRSLDPSGVPPRNLTFLLDVSGSMRPPDKLPLLKRAMGLLVDNLREEDRVAIVVYAGAAGLVLPPTSGAERATILAAIDRLEAGGSTAGGAGIELAYRVAADSFVPKGINRVILATDGDFNVGVSSEGQLVRLIEEKRETGVFLSVLGFGQGNLQDSRMEKIADHGNGNYSYVDSLLEARKVLVSEAGGTLVTIAKDVKIQVEFNPARVAAYRLIGYENRALRPEDFADDRKDAGEIGAGHTVTALYEVVPAGVEIDLPAVDPLRYQQKAPATTAHADELLTVKLRHKEPDGERSKLQSVVVRDDSGAGASDDLRFASAVAGFGMLLRDSEHRGTASWAQVADLAEGALGDDSDGYRLQFLELVRRAEELSGAPPLAMAR